MTTVIYRPTGNGTYQECSKGSGGTYHWDCVDEASPDGSTTVIYHLDAAYATDTFTWADPTETGSITKITISHASAYVGSSGVYAKSAIYTSGQTLAYGAERTLTSTYDQYDDDWTTNPWTAAAWTWADLNALEFGVSLKGKATHSAWCTQVFITIDYSLSARNFQVIMC
jgi:hypothetical protein